MSRALSQLSRRTHFNKPLVEETLTHLPAALNHPTTVEFKRYLIEHLPQSGRSTRERYAEYISERFSIDGQMNRALARAIARFGSMRAGREILFFEMLRSVPVFHDASFLWLAEQDAKGGSRGQLIDFLKPRLTVDDIGEVASVLITSWRRLGKIKVLKRTDVLPNWVEPSVEAFLYALAILVPERTMVRVDLLAGMPILRAMLWPRSCLEPLLHTAQRMGHVSKISELDQYHQFTLAESGSVRMEWLLADSSQVTARCAGAGA